MVLLFWIKKNKLILSQYSLRGARELSVVLIKKIEMILASKSGDDV